MKMIGLGLEYWYDTFNVFDTVVNVTSLAMFLLEIFSDSESSAHSTAFPPLPVEPTRLLARAFDGVVWGCGLQYRRYQHCGPCASFG
jgi:hypothetical protein